MTSLGNMLKKGREHRSLTLEEIAQATNIRLSYLKAIENDRLDSLSLDPFFIKAYLRAYADYVGLDPSEIIKFYNQTLNQRPDDNTDRFIAAKKPQAAKSKKALMALIAIFLLLAIIGYFLLKPSANKKQSQTALTAQQSPVEESLVPRSVEDRNLLSKEETTKLVSPPVTIPKLAEIHPNLGLTLEHKQVPTEDLESSLEAEGLDRLTMPKQLEVEQSELKTDFSARSEVSLEQQAYSETTGQEKKPSIKESIEAVVPVQQKPPSSGPSLRVTASQQVWLIVRTDQKPSQYIILEAGESRQWEAAKWIVFSLGDTKAAEIFINGEAVSGLANKSKALKNIKITSDSSKDNLF